MDFESENIKKEIAGGTSPDILSIPLTIKILAKYFLVVFLAGFLIINWQEVSWVFNYKVFSGFISGVFQKSNFETIAGSKESETEIQKNILEIPKIKVSVPLVFVENEQEVDKALYQGAVHFPGTALPGKEGQTVVLGHSAPQGWPKMNYPVGASSFGGGSSAAKIKYDWIFSQIEELAKGDEILIYFKGQKYVFVVVGKTILKRGGEIPSFDLTKSRNVLVLISCWPPGKDYKRIAVAAALKD